MSKENQAILPQKKKFLVIGAGGLVGQPLFSELLPGHNVFGTTLRKNHRVFLPLDVTSVSQVRLLIKDIKPDCLIACHNLRGGVKYCQKNPDAAKKVHFEAIKVIGRQCGELGIRLIYISSECVFDGKKEIYTEEDKTKPLSVYGAWKAKAEEWIQDHLTDYAVIRTMSVFGWQPETKTPNAMMSAYFAITQKRKLEISTLRSGTPTYTKDLAKAILELSLSREGGIFHITGLSYLNRYEWLCKTCEALGWDSSFLIPVEKSSPENTLYPLKIKLSTEKFRSRFKTKLHTLPEALALLKQDVHQALPAGNLSL